MLATLSGGAMLGVPLLLLQTATPTAARPAPAGGQAVAVHASSATSAGPPVGWQLTTFGGTTATTATTAPVAPVPTATPTTTPPAPAPAPKVVAPPATTTTVLRAVAASSNTATGVATWYSAAPAGTCASPTLAFGTVLTVTNTATGARTVCTVADREGNNPGRIVDLSTSGFSQIAPLSQGVVTVTVSW